MWNKHHTININKTHISNSTQINPTHIRTTYISNLNNNSKYKKSKAINMKFIEKNRKPIPFLEDWSKDDEEHWWILRETRWVCERDEWTRQWIVKTERGKTEKILKTVLKSQNTRFLRLKWVANKLLDQVAKTFETKIWKICLSVFRD